jgi:type IV pilus assembly protein PilV
MGKIATHRCPAPQQGGLLIEVLVTIVILAIGLLGLMQMQGRLQKSEVESYQRSHALMLANDMATRISANRSNADSYIIGDPNDPTSLGGDPCPAGSTTVQEVDRAEWCNALQGASEVQSSDNVGGLINGRGCIYELVEDEEYMVTVVWQGLTPISAPPVICGRESPNPYDGPAGSDCVDDLCRRYVTTIVRLGNLPP